MPSKPFWYLRYKKDGIWKKGSTGLRHDDPNDTAKARALRAEAEAAEFRAAPVSKIGWEWVNRFVETSGLSEKTIIRYRGAWSWVQMFLQEKHLSLTDVRYPHVEEYMVWRVGRKKKSGKRAGRNTAILEIKFLQLLLNEAVRRSLIIANPLASLKLHREDAKPKRAFTPEEIEACREALKSREDWMRVSFEIALFTGCRLRETRIPLTSIDLDAEVPTITFPTPKGGRKKAFSIPVPSSLFPMFRAMKQHSPLSHTIREFPFQPSRCWQNFFKRVGLHDVCFHCLRVTKITQMRREGVPREVAMRLVNHSSELIHLLYDRHRVQDLAAYADAGSGGYAAATPQNPTKTPFRRPKEKSGRSKYSSPFGRKILSPA